MDSTGRTKATRYMRALGPAPTIRWELYLLAVLALLGLLSHPTPRG